MNLTTATPVEIDTVIAEIYVRFNTARRDIAVQAHYLDDAETRLDQMESGTYRYFFTPSDVERTRKSVDDLRAKVADMQDAALAVLAEARPYDAEWVRRGRWSRFYLVDNGHGHVHSSMECSTTYPTTEWIWLPEVSGSTEAEVVAQANEQACTVCFSSAPVDKGRRGTFEAPAKRKSRLEREEAKRVREEARAAKAIANPDGNPLSVFDYHYDARQVQQYDRAAGGYVMVTKPAHDTFETLKTLAAAKAWLTDSQDGWTRKREADVARVAEAIAHKVGTHAQDEIEAARGRAKRRK